MLRSVACSDLLPHGPGLISDIDTLIAATTLERNPTVVTTDSDYEQVPGLKVRRISLKRF
jgi:predicted nucleic acid-binding protein